MVQLSKKNLPYIILMMHINTLAFATHEIETKIYITVPIYPSGIATSVDNIFYILQKKTLMKMH